MKSSIKLIFVLALLFFSIPAFSAKKDTLDKVLSLKTIKQTFDGDTGQSLKGGYHRAQ